MMKIFLNWEGSGIKPLDSIGSYIKKNVLGLLRKHKADGELGITFCSDLYIKKLNGKYRKKEKPTDVLSFEFGDGKKLFGDIYISIPTAKRQAKEYNVTLKEEILRLAMHGTLHVLGYNHKEMGIYGN